MNHDDIVSRIETRLDKIEEKLDRYLEVSSANKTDINWLRGSIKLITTFILSLAGGVILALVKLFTNN